MTRTMSEARRSEVVHTLFGRRRAPRRSAEHRPTDGGPRRSGSRRNTPIQGTAADLLKLAMLKVAELESPGARMVLTVHDELVLEVAEKEVDATVTAVRRAMETAYPLDVPLVVTVSSGPTWADA